jgi:hypothetical protein
MMQPEISMPGAPQIEAHAQLDMSQRRLRKVPNERAAVQRVELVHMNLVFVSEPKRSWSSTPKTS